MYAPCCTRLTLRMCTPHFRVTCTLGTTGWQLRTFICWYNKHLRSPVFSDEILFNAYDFLYVQTQQMFVRISSMKGQVEWSKIAPIMKLLHHAILVLDERCSASLMSANSSKTHFTTFRLCLSPPHAVFDHTYICALHARGLLCTCVHIS